MTKRISEYSDVLDTRDIIERIEELREERDDESNAEEWNHPDKDGPAELRELEEFMSDMAGCGGDEQWEGIWYPIMLIRDSYFRDYAEELAEDCGMVQSGATWPNNCIDWDEAARQLRMDYTSADFRGVTFWFR